MGILCESVVHIVPGGERNTEYAEEPKLINDIAILEMDPEIQFTDNVQPIVMADEEFSTSNLFVDASGYGKNCFESCPITNLKKVELSTLSLEECRQYHMKILPNMICYIDKNRRSTSK